MKACLIIPVIAFMVQVYGQKQRPFPDMHGSFVHPKIELIVSGHRTIAFVGEYGYLSRRVDANSVLVHDSVLSKASRSLTRLFYGYYEENRLAFRVNCQHPDITYARLDSAGIGTKNLAFYSRQQLAEILGVDAVVTVRCLVFKKYSPGEATLINIAGIAATFTLAAMGNYSPLFQFQAGTDVFYLNTSVHDASGEFIYMDRGLETAFPKLNPGGLRYMKNQPGFPYLKQ